MRLFDLSDTTADAVRSAGHFLSDLMTPTIRLGVLTSMFGVIARRGAWQEVGGDPVPQALVITGIVVAFAATALAVALLLRLFKESGEATLDPPASAGVPPGRRES